MGIKIVSCEPKTSDVGPIHLMEDISACFTPLLLSSDPEV